MTLELKYLLYLTGKFFDLKNIPFRYYEFLVANDTYLWDYLHHKDGYRQKLLYMHHNSVLGHFYLHFRPSHFFLLYEIGPHCFVKVPGYTSKTWHAGKLSMFISNQNGDISQKDITVLQNCYIVNTYI